MRRSVNQVNSSSVIAVLMGSTILASPVWGQDANADGTALEEITVTARKNVESLTDVPLAITALTAEALENRGITDIFQVAQFTPGFRFQNQAVGRNDRGFKQYVIRGMVPNSALATRQSVTLFVDGAPVAGGNINGVTDIERVETIKGPQSAFFGRATFAGAINFITRAPSYDWGGNASVQYESYNTIDANASIEGGIIADKLAFRLSGRYYDTDGAYKNSGWPGERLGARQTKSVSLSLLAEPTETLRIRFFGTRWKDSDGLPANAILSEESHNCTVPGNGVSGAVGYFCGKLPDAPVASRTWDMRVEPVAYDAVQNGTTIYGPGFIDHLGLERTATQLRVNVDWEIGDFTLSGIGSYGKNKWAFLQTTFGLDVRNIPNPTFNGTTRPLRGNYSLVIGNTQDVDKYLEVRLSSPADRRLRGMLGVNYYNGETHNLTAGYVASSGYSLFTPETVNSSKTYGVFGSVNWEVVDNLIASAEGRYQVDKLFQQTLFNNAPSFSDDFESFTPRFILSFKPTADSSVYASYSVGNRPGEFNTIFRTLNPVAQQQVLDASGGVAESVPEDKVKMGEIGFKGTMLDNRLRVLVAAYYGMWTNRHIPNNIPYYNALNPDGTPVVGEPLRGIQLTNSNGKVELKGLEIETAYVVAPGLTLEGTFSIADTKIKRTGCTDCLALIGTLNPVGTQLPFYPKYSGTASAMYEHELTGDSMLFARGDVIYTGRQYETEANLAYSRPAAIVNVRFGAEIENYRLELFARNLFDNDTITSLARGTQALYTSTGATARTPNAITVSLPEPQTFGVRASVKY